MFKSFDFAGHHRIQLRVEGFNIWNQPRASRTAHRYAPFGQITSAEDGRIVQLGIKHLF